MRLVVQVALVLLTSELPDPGHPSFMTTCAGFGLFVGMVVGRVRRLPWKRTGRLAAECSAVGYGAGLLIWIVAFAIDRL